MYMSIHVIQIRNDLDDVNLNSPFLFQFICTDDCTFSTLFYMYSNMIKYTSTTSTCLVLHVNEDPLLLPFNTCCKLTKALYLSLRAFVLNVRSVHFCTQLNKVHLYTVRYILFSDNIGITLSDI